MVVLPLYPVGAERDLFTPSFCLSSLRLSCLQLSFVSPLARFLARLTPSRSLTHHLFFALPGNVWRGFQTQPVRGTRSTTGLSCLPCHIVGVRVSSPSVGVEVQLLPGQYSSSTNPQLLHSLLTDSSTQYTPSPGFNSSSASSSSLPFDVALQPGFSIYSSPLYGGQASFAPLPQNATNTSSGFSASSLAISDGVWLAVKAGTSQSRMILWDSIPDTTQINGLTGLTLVDMQSSSCSTPCSSAGLCTTSGKCSCFAGFTGESCETCAPGFFGPTCQACPANCTSCDQGISGSGRCLTPIVSNPPSSCNCLNGQCQSNGQCTCNSGWTAASNGTACAACATGFFQDSNGDCSKCELGCDQCESGSGICTACASGFTQDANDRTKCNAATSVTTSGTQCPDGSFSNGTACAACSTSCTTCNGPTSNDCIVCANGQYKLNGTCVTTDTNGVCSGSSMIANNNKHECDCEYSPLQLA